ncbi:extracellular solute-binding protein [Bombiscardovia coagulans]|uniref:ABC transporter substrate-binding protein n=1 Tax=Bombiscardovia coagulans TaxID=686666 RepID=A0A261ESZ1_9BIFI|nr:extracellular solute-binding protein [Bombiscardovia coagulans]OZG49935.1 ABC transporter substrate-binding protein [Bombiscardovia coagulans]
MISRFHTLIAGMVSIAALVSLTACGRTQEDAGKDDTAVTSIDSSKANGQLTIWAMGNEGEKMGGFIKQFEKENPDVKISVTSIPWSSYKDKFQTAIAAGTGPDVAMMGNTDMATYSKALSPVPSNLDMKDLNEGLKSSGKVGNTQVGVPMYVDTRVLYYRTDIAQQAGWGHAPKNWDELQKMSQDLKKVDGVKFGFFMFPTGTDSFQGMSPFAFSAGSQFVSKDNKSYTFNTPELKETLNYTTSLFKDGLANVNADVTPGANMQQFVSGATPMMLEGPTAAGQINELGGPGFSDKYATAVMPAKTSSTSFVGGCNLSVFKSSNNKQSAWKFIQWFVQPKTQVNWYKVTADLPASNQAWKDKELTENTKLQAFGEQLKHVQSMPVTYTWGEMSKTADTIYEKMNKGTISVDEGLKELQQQADSIGTGM